MQSVNDVFTIRAGELFCEEVCLIDVAEQFGTPCYVYSYSRVVKNYRAFDAAFSAVPHLIAYAVKANSNGAILRCLAQEGCGADVVSGGELARALAAGIPPERVVFAGVGKRKQELERALEAKILLLNAESMGELEAIRELASKRRQSARVAIRINPDVAAGAHTYVATGRAQDKFGIPVSKAVAAFRYASTYPELVWPGYTSTLAHRSSNLSPTERLCTLLSTLSMNLPTKVSRSNTWTSEAAWGSPIPVRPFPRRAIWLRLLLQERKIGEER